MADTDWLPKPFIANYEWQADAACRGMDSATFFHPTKEQNAQRRQRIAAAKAICDNCLAINACLAHALHAREPYGIWGGLSEYERARILGVHSLRYPAPVTAETSRRIERILLTLRQPQIRDDTTP